MQDEYLEYPIFESDMIFIADDSMYLPVFASEIVIGSSNENEITLHKGSDKPQMAKTNAATEGSLSDAQAIAAKCVKIFIDRLEKDHIGIGSGGEAAVGRLFARAVSDGDISESPQAEEYVKDIVLKLEFQLMLKGDGNGSIVEADDVYQIYRDLFGEIPEYQDTAEDYTSKKMRKFKFEMNFEDIEKKPDLMEKFNGFICMKLMDILKKDKDFWEEVNDSKNLDFLKLMNYIHVDNVKNTGREPFGEYQLQTYIIDVTLDDEKLKNYYNNKNNKNEIDISNIPECELSKEFSENEASTELLDCWEIKRLCNKERRTLDDYDIICDEDYLEQMNSFKKNLSAVMNQEEDIGLGSTDAGFMPKSTPITYISKGDIRGISTFKDEFYRVSIDRINKAIPNGENVLLAYCSEFYYCDAKDAKNKRNGMIKGALLTSIFGLFVVTEHYLILSNSYNNSEQTKVIEKNRVIDIKHVYEKTIGGLGQTQIWFDDGIILTVKIDRTYGNESAQEQYDSFTREINSIIPVNKL